MSSLTGSTLVVEVPSQCFDSVYDFFQRYQKRPRSDGVVKDTMSQNSTSASRRPRSVVRSVSSTSASTYALPDRQKSCGNYNAAGQRPPPRSAYSPGGAGYPVTATATSTKAQSRNGYVPEMPRPDYFTSGASKRERSMRYTASSYSSPATHSADAASVARSVYSRRNSEHNKEVVRYFDDNADNMSVLPSDSISQVSSAGSSRSARSKRSSATSHRRDSAVLLGEVPEADGSIGDLADDEKGFGEGEEPYYDEIHGYWVRDVTPSWARRWNSAREDD